jgi:hypothetical protein
MSTQGIAGFYIETRNYGATAAFWRSLGFANAFETDHGSGQWEHPTGGAYVFIAERADPAHVLLTYPVLAVEDSTRFAPVRAPKYVRPFEPQHWGVVEALVADPDERLVSLQAPVPDGVDTPDLRSHHQQKYG